MECQLLLSQCMNRLWKITSFIFIPITFLALQSLAQVSPAHEIGMLNVPESQISSGGRKVVFVKTGTISITDDDLLTRDFPFLKSLDSNQRSLWLQENVFVLAESQLVHLETQSTVAAQDFAGRPNSFPQLPRVMHAYRPRGYGRALILEVVDPLTNKTTGLFDVKGAGAELPSLNPESNGLASFAECVREFLFEKLVSRVFHFAKSGFVTVGTYALGDYRFNLREKTAKGEILEERAGIVVRQASPRFLENTPYGDDYAPEALPWKIEKILRRFGITSAGDDSHGIANGDGLNIQATADLKGVVDFGGFLVRNHFSKDVYQFYDGARMREGQQIAPLVKVDDPEFIQPKPNVQIPFEIWGDTKTAVASPRYDNPLVFSEELARSKSLDEPIPREWVEAHYKNMMGPVEKLLPVERAELYQRRDCIAILERSSIY